MATPRPRSARQARPRPARTRWDEAGRHAPGAGAAWLVERLAGLPPLPFDLVSRRAYRARAVALDEPALLLVLQGAARLRCAGRLTTCAAGAYAAVHRPAHLDLDALPEPDGRPHRALAIPFPASAVELARTLLAASSGLADAERPVLTTGSIDSLRPELEALLDVAPRCGPGSAVLAHRLLGLLVALAGAGQDHFLWAGAPGLGSRIRTLVGAEPAFPWAARHLEERLNLSAPALRRGLAEEGSRLPALLREARLHHAFYLLQSSGRPVAAVAAACGYRSVATFRRSFAARFGVAAARLADA
jgi:AraC-like DNA-binding protein